MMDASSVSIEVDCQGSEDEHDLDYWNLLRKNLFICHEKHHYWDVKLKVGEKIFKCHRIVLALNSKYFVSLFKSDFKEANEETKTLPDEFVDEASFSKLLLSLIHISEPTRPY